MKKKKKKRKKKGKEKESVIYGIALKKKCLALAT